MEGQSPAMTYIPDDLITVMCSCGKADWCEHRAEVVKFGTDAGPLWERLFYRYEQDEMDIGSEVYGRVALVPSRDLFAEVALKPIRKTAWRLFIEVDDVFDVAGESFFVGVVTPGDGHGVMRGMLTAWLAAQDEPGSCRSTSHSFKQSKLIQTMVAKNDLAFIFAHKWSMRFTGRCVECNKIFRNKDEFDDLVPVMDQTGIRKQVFRK